MSRTIDKKIQIKMLLDASQALRQVDSLAKRLEKITQITKGNAGEFLNKVADSAKQASNALGQTETANKKAGQSFNTLTNQLKKAKQEYDVLYTKFKTGLYPEINLAKINAAAEKVRNLTQSVDAMKSKLKENVWNGSMSGDMVTQTRAEVRGLERQILDARLAGNKELEKSLLNQYKQKKDLLRVDESMVRSENKLLATQKEIAALRNKYQNALKTNDAQGMSNALVGLQGLGAGNPSTYATQLATMRRQAESLFLAMKNGSKEAGAEFNKLMGAAQKLNRESVEFNKVWGITGRGFYDLGHNMDYFFAKARSHLAWIGSGLVLGSMFALPSSAFESIKKVESHMAGMQQVNQKLHDSQKALNSQTMEFLDIAARYGEKVENIIEAGTLWGRAYKDLNMVNALVRQSSILAVADNFSLKEANKALEAAMFQYGLVAKNTSEAVAYSSKIIDVWTNVAHNAQVSAQDLAHATERAGSVARITGVDFEFLTAMISTGVRATGRSGAEIGNMIKSVLGSFHSDKAVEELEKIGVKAKQVGKNGQLEFRKAQEVLLELSLAAESTDKNVENLFKQISGGKFQWAKAAAMLGDYKQFIHDWGLAINSQGVAAKQVEMQLDTISRRLQTLSTDIDKTFVGAGNSGLTIFLKEQIASINNFIIGLQHIPSAAWQAMGTLTYLSAAVYGLVKAYNLLRTAILAAEAAQRKLAARNLLILGIIAASYYIGKLVEDYGALENAEREEQQQTKDGIAAKAQEIDVLKQKGEFIDTLIIAYKKLSAEIESGILSDEKAVLAKENLKATEEELTIVLGHAAVERIRQNNWSEESIKKEKDAFLGAINEKEIALSHMRASLAQDLDNKIEWLRNCVQAYYDEVDAFKDSIEKKINLLGLWKTAQLTAHEWGTKFNEIKRDNAIEMLEKFKDDPQRLAYWQKVKDHADNDIAYHQNKGKDIVNEGLNDLKERLNNAYKERLKISNPNFNPANIGGNLVDTSGEKGSSGGSSGKGAGADVPKSLEERLNRLNINLDMAKMFSEAEIAAKKYETALAGIEGKEQLYGLTLDTIKEKHDLINGRINQAMSDKDAFQKVADEYEKEVSEKISAIPQLIDYLKEKQTSWCELDKESKRELLEQLRGYTAEYETINKLASHGNKAREKAASLEKEIVNLTNKRQRNDNIDLLTVYKNEIEKISQDEKLAHLLNGRFETGEQNRQAELAALIAKLTELKKIRDELINQSKDNPDILNSKEYKETIINIEETKQKIAETKDIFAGLKKGFADTLLDMANGQKKFGDFFKSLWQELAKEAIYRIFKIKTATSILGGIFQAIGGVKTAAPAPKTAHTGGVISAYPKMHSGGNVGGSPIVPYLRSDEVIRTLQVGEEVNSIRERRTTEIMAAVAMKAMSNKQEQQQPIVVYAMDAQSVADFFTRNGELMAAVLRNPKYSK